MLVFFGVFFIAIIAYAYHSSRRHALTTRMLHFHLDDQVVKPGETATGFINLRIDRPLKLRSISAQVWGGEHAEVLVSHGKYTSAYISELPILDEELPLQPEGLAAAIPRNVKDPLLLASGNYYYRFSINIPPTALPSWMSQLACVRYFVRVRVDLPGYPDPIGEQDIRVVPESQAPKTRPMVYKHQGNGYDARSPTFNIELSSVEIAPGHRLSGRVLYSSPTGKRIRAVKLQLIERIWKNARGYEDDVRRPIAELTLQPQGNGTTIAMPFTINIPQDVFPTVRGRICSLQYFIQAKADIALARDIIVMGEVFIVFQED